MRRLANPANMIALPLIVGVGGRRSRVARLSQPRGWRGYRLGSATGRWARRGAHHGPRFQHAHYGAGTGMASLGLALTLGVAFCMLAALVFLPAVLRLRDLRPVEARQKPRDGPALADQAA